MAVFSGSTGKKAAAEVGFHAEVLSDGKNAVLSILDLTTQVWRMAFIEDASGLSSNATCTVFAIRASISPKDQGAVTEDENEAIYDRCLDLEDRLKAELSPPGEGEVDVDEEEEDEDNDYL
jgi:hypothetical protein